MKLVSTVDPFIEMESAIQNMVYELFTDEELLLLLRSDSDDPLNDTSTDVVRDVNNPGLYMLYKGYDVQETDSHRIFLTSNNIPTIEDESKVMLFPHITNIKLPYKDGTNFIQFDVTFEIWIHCKLWVTSGGGFRWTQIMSRINKIYNKKHNGISMNTPPLNNIRFVYPKNGWNGFAFSFKFTTTNFLVE